MIGEEIAGYSGLMAYLKLRTPNDPVCDFGHVEAHGLTIYELPGQDTVSMQLSLQFTQKTLALLQVNTRHVLPSQLPAYASLLGAAVNLWSISTSLSGSLHVVVKEEKEEEDGGRRIEESWTPE
jgi:hypothetical protein